MPWINLSDEEVKHVCFALDALRDEASDEEATRIRKYIEERTAPNPQADLYYGLATDFDGPYRLSEPDEFENPPFVSQSEEGAYVMAWVWVDKPAGPEEYLIELVEADEVIHAELFLAVDDIEASKRSSDYWNDTPQAVLNGERFEVRLYYAEERDDGDEIETIGGCDDD